jgi:signal transduction histidine kinase
LAFTQTVIGELVSAAERTRDAGAMFRVLASVGTQMARFVHEIRGLLGTAIAVHEAVGRLRDDPTVRGDVRRRLTDIHASLGDLRRQIERQAAYLVDVTAPDARRRRSRQKLAERFDAAARLVGPAIDRRSITLLNEIPPGLKSPPMFAAEVTTVFSNLLTNAVKAAGEGGTIRGRGGLLPEGGVVVVVENTGVAVDLADAERWFLPFESTTTEVDAALGQGMGLGLTITRDMLEQYGATIRFVATSEDYQTAVEVRFPE